MRLPLLAATALTASLVASSAALAAPKAGGGDVMGYAITWFSLAAALLGVTLVFARGRARKPRA